MPMLPLSEPIPGLDASLCTKIGVNVGKCEELGRLLASQFIPLDEEDARLDFLSREEAGNFYLLLVAICHQTSPRGRPPLEGTVNGKKKRGWDYLSAKLEEAVALDRSWLSPERWVSVETPDFTGLFRDSILGDRLADPGCRVSLVQDLGRRMLAQKWFWLEDLYRICAARAATGSPNLFGLLSQFAAYRDPVRKKSSFLLALMRNSGLWQYVDNEKLGPPVDYHEVRGHLRIGTVTVHDPELRCKLLSSVPVTPREDVEIRAAVYKAIMLLSELTELRNPSQLHYLFWNVFRTHCLREQPLCHEAAPALPERYQHLASDGVRRCCPFSTVCQSASATHRYFEHVFDTDYY